jgi:hypothetical protein
MFAHPTRDILQMIEDIAYPLLRAFYESCASLEVDLQVWISNDTT